MDTNSFSEFEEWNTPLKIGRWNLTISHLKRKVIFQSSNFWFHYWFSRVDDVCPTFAWIPLGVNFGVDATHCCLKVCCLVGEKNAPCADGKIIDASPPISLHWIEAGNICYIYRWNMIKNIYIRWFLDFIVKRLNILATWNLHIIKIILCLYFTIFIHLPRDRGISFWHDQKTWKNLMQWHGPCLVARWGILLGGAHHLLSG